MKKIELKKTLEERVRDTEWTDANTWNVLRKIRSAKSLRSEFSLRRLAPAVVALLLVMGIGIATLTGTPGNPDSIRDKAQYTVQPMVTALSAGQGEGNGDLPEEAVGCEDSLLPVNLGCERQGIRVDVVAGLAAGNESYVKYAIQDIENKYPGLEMEPEKMINTILPEDCDADGTMYADEIMTCDVNVDELYRNMYIIGNHHSRKIQGEDQEITLGIRDMRIMQRTDIDLHPYIQEYAKPEEGISREGYKILDPEKKLSIPLGREDLLLTGIGWIDNQLHVRIEYTGESFVKNVTSYDNVCDVWISGDLIHPTETRSGVDYTMLTSGTTKYEEILDCGPDNYGEVSLIAHCSVLEDVVQGNWSVNLPLSMICPEIEPAVDAAEAVREQMEINYPGIADQLRPINLSSEKDGVRLEVVSGLVKDYESWIVYSAQDVEGKYPESMLRAICNDNVSGAEYGGETPFLFADEKEHKYYFCNHIVYDEPVNKADRLISVTMDSYEVQREVKLDLAQLLKEHGTTSEGVLSPELMPWITAEGLVPQGKVTVLDYNKPLNIPVLGDVLLTGAGWIDGKIHVQFHNPDAHGIPGERVSVLSNWIVSLYYDDEYWKEDLYDSALWDENGDDCNDWEEIILNCDQEYLEKMNAQVNVTVTDALVEKQMEVKVPLNLICGDVEPAEAEGAENLLDPDVADTLREFFCSWAGGDMSGMWQKTASEWIMSRNDGEGSLRSLIASGKPLSYQVNGVSGNDGDAERMITCTVEMENPVGEEPMHRQYAVTIRRGEYWYEIDPESFDRWETGNYDPDLDTVSLDEAENATWLISKDCPEMMNDGEILKLSSEKKGITMTVLSGEVREQMASFLCEVYDPEGRYSEFPYDLSWNVDIGTGAEVSAYPVYRSTEAHKVLYKVNVIYSEPVSSEDRTVTLGMNSVNVREGTQADLTEKVKKYAKTAEGVEPPDIALKILQNRHTGPKEVPGLKVLDDADSLDIPLFGNTYLTGAGWVDGKLHVRIRTDRTSVEGYTAFWMNVDSGENTDILLKQADYSPLDWYDDTAYWYEYVLDYTPEDLEKISLTFNALYNQKTLTDDWTVSFPLNSIRTESKAAEKSEAEKKADEWRTPLLDRVDEFFTAWQNGDTESMLAMCTARWRDNKDMLIQILDNRVPESWKVSEIRGLQTPVATVGIDIHMQPEETNGVYLVKMKKETDGIWYFEPDGLYAASESYHQQAGMMHDEEVILTGTPKNSEAKTEVPPFVGVVTDFLTCWNKGDTDGMLALCPPSMRDEGYSNSMKYLVTGFGKPLEWKLGQLYGAPGDESRAMACEIQFRLGNDDLMWYSFDIVVTKDTNVQWYVNPNSLHEAASEITGTIQRAGKKVDNNIAEDNSGEDNQVEKEIIKRLNKFYSCWIQRDKEGMLALCKPKEDNSGYQNVTDYMLEFGILNGFDSGEIGETGDENTRNLHGIVSCRTGDGKDHLYSVDFKMEKADDGLWYVGLDEVTFGLIDTVENQGTSSGNGEAKAEPDIESILKELRPVNNYYEMTEQARMEVVAGLVKDNECWLEYSVETLDDRYTIPEKDLSWFATLYTGDHDNQFPLEPLQPAVCVSVDEAQHKATWLHGYKCYYPYKEVNLEDIYLMTGVSNLILQENGETGETKDASIMAVTVPMNNISDHEIANMPDYMNPAPTPSPAPAKRSGRPVRVGLELGKDTLSGPETIDVTITVTNVSGDTLAGPVTLYDSDGNQVAEYGSEDFAAGETKEWTGKWTVTEEQLADGKVSFSVLYCDYKEGTQDIMAHKLTFSKPITKE